MPSDRLFGPALTTEAMRNATSDEAWVAAMLRVEGALALAEARVGLIPGREAEQIAAACRAQTPDTGRLGLDAVPAGSPVVPLVKALGAALPPEAARFVHWGATSQDIIDTAMMLIARAGLDLVAADLRGAADAAASLADSQRATVLPGRTLLQQALPTTLGLKAAGWLVAIVEARRRLVTFRRGTLAVQLGGAVGTLASLGGRGLEVARALGDELELAEPVVPWHASRGRIAELGSALGIAAGTMGKIALDVALMMQTEVGEVSEPAGPGRGASSTMPHKRNPVGAVAVNACVRGVNAQAAVLLGSLVQEHERAVGAWQAEWPAVSEALRLTAGAVARTREMLEGLDVDAGRMRRNLEMTGGLLLSEHVMIVLAERVGLPAARELVDGAVASAAGTGRPFRDVLLAEPAITRHMGPADIDAALDPAGYLGSADALVDRALAAHRAEGGER